MATEGKQTDTNSNSTKSSKTAPRPMRYYDEDKNEMTRMEWIADQLLTTYMAMSKPNPSPAVLATMAEDLAAELTDVQLRTGLSRLRKEREWVTAKAIIELSGAALEDGRPEMEVAWAMCPKTESVSVVWTAEMAEAFGACRDLLMNGDDIAARMVFKEQYAQLTTRARANKVPVVWTASLGWDASDRVRALMEAVQKRRISAEFAFRLVGAEQQEEMRSQLQLPALRQPKLLGGKTEPVNQKLLSGLQKATLKFADKHGMTAEPRIEKPSILDSPEAQAAECARQQAMVRRMYPQKFKEAT